MADTTFILFKTIKKNKNKTKNCILPNIFRHYTCRPYKMKPRAGGLDEKYPPQTHMDPLGNRALTGGNTSLEVGFEGLPLPCLS